MTHSDPNSLIRIAIALAAATHKPRDQSTTSYLLDLQARFPLATKENDGREWRTYALELEKQIAALKAQRDADQELLSKLPTDASQATSTSDPPPKKKSKKNLTKDQHELDWNWDQSRAHWSRFLSSQYPSSPSLVAAHASLKGVLASPNADLYSSRLTDAILRALDTIHVFLFSPPNLSPDLHTQTTLGAPLQRNAQHVDSARIAITSPLLMFLLRIAFPALLRTTQRDNTKSKRQRQRIHPAAVASTDAHTHADRVLDHLLECVLLPLLRALAPLCFARLAHLVTPPSKKPVRPVGKGKSKDKRAGATPVHPPKHTDTRTDAFALIGTSLEALDALPHPAHAPGCTARSIALGIRDRLGLEAIRELESLYAAPPPHSSQPELSLSAVTPSEAPPSLPTPTPTPLSAQLQPQRMGPESRAKRLERLAGTREERVRVLAIRDAGWFLASTLSLCVTPPPAVGTSGSSPYGEQAAGAGSGGLLREALLDRVGKLVRSVPVVWHDAHDDDSDRGHTDYSPIAADASKLAIDPVCQNMLLAICERTMTQLAP